jgi:Ig-like domain from next to BRCA1 gene
LTLLGVWLSACAVPEASPTPTQAPLFRPLPPASATPTRAPAASATSVPLGSPVPTLPCTNDARFVEDLTVPDGTVVSPGVELDKRWSVLNAGTCDWNAGYRLVRVGTSAIEGSAELALFPARAGATAEWQVEVRTPSEPGEYLARWRARAPDGTLFGEEVYLLIFVEEATAVPSASPSATP